MNESKIAEIYQNEEFMCVLKSFFFTNRNHKEPKWLFLAYNVLFTVYDQKIIV